MEQLPESVRRKDRWQEDDLFLKSLLREQDHCSVSLETTGWPVLTASFFVYDDADHSVIWHASKHGHIGEAIVDGKKACISVYKSGKLYTAKKAIDFGGEYESIIIYGHLTVFEDVAKKIDAMQLFFDKFFKHIPKSDYAGISEIDVKQIHVMKVPIEKWFGKKHLVPESATSSFDPKR